ncbi:unnamed protein product [Protopolystoma xenopodis]|uniref:Uncharacterized protein n=1 Tax=Protopolystoma xenopodis TaxID=117903 RepID=A0A448XP12_9PLAT|nr:unnamed protein product [Protopolystoma xenopodis]
MVLASSLFFWTCRPALESRGEASKGNQMSGKLPRQERQARCYRGCGKWLIEGHNRSFNPTEGGITTKCSTLRVIQESLLRVQQTEEMLLLNQ